MLSKLVQDKINEQINNELSSSYSYLAMAAYCEHMHFTGCAHWLRIQSQEEQTHAMRLFNFLIARGGRVVLSEISAPQKDYESIIEVFRATLAQEQQVTSQIDSLYEMALKEKAFAALVELEWFIQEQVEEEKSARDILHKFEMVEGDPAALVDLDERLGARPAEESA